MGDPLSISDLRAIEGEGRFLDLRIAERLGYERPRKIRELIERNRELLERVGSLPHRGAMIEIGKGARREVQEYYLNRKQALLICMWSETPIAADIQIEIVEVYDQWLGQTVMPLPPQTNRLLQNLEPMLGEIARDVKATRADVVEVKDNVTYIRRRIDDNVPRRDFTQQTERAWRKVIAAPTYSNKCPCCRRVPILTKNRQKLDTWRNDHFIRRDKNRMFDGWPVCKLCNDRLEDNEFKDNATAHFRVFQANLRQSIGEALGVEFGPPVNVAEAEPFQSGEQYDLFNEPEPQ